MTFPQTPLDFAVELLLNGTWIDDITLDVYARDGLTISRGRSDESSLVSPARAEFTLNNRDGRYSPRNPLSPLYGLIGRNTPVRISVATGTSPRLVVPAAGARATTPDTAVLDVVGDLDVRVDVLLHDWAPSLDTELAGKWDRLTAQRSWAVAVAPGGFLRLLWSPDGATVNSAYSTVPVTAPASGRLAVRATLDVDNGASGRTVTFYTAATNAGPWTQLGATVITAGVTSIYAGAAPLDIGDVVGLGLTAPGCAFYAVEVRSGIGGTVVASPDFTAQALGATAFSDSSGRPWTVTAPASLSNGRDIRFMGEISEWPSRWQPGGVDVWVPVEAAGILRRLGQGAAPLDSTLRRRIPSDPNLVAYWPMEDGPTATQAYSPTAGVAPMRTTGVTFGADDTLPGSSALPSLAAGASISAVVPTYTGTSQWHVEHVFYLGIAPATYAPIITIASSGTARTWTVSMQSGAARVQGRAADGTLLVDNAFAIGPESFGTWTRMRLTVSSDSGTATWALSLIVIGGNGGTPTGTYTGAAGTVTRVYNTATTDTDGLRLGHLAVLKIADSSIFDNADKAFDSEATSGRYARLTGEEGIPALLPYGSSSTPALGPQRPGTVLALLQDGADADVGILGEARESIALSYRPRVCLYNQPTALTLDYAAGDVAPPLEPTEDDRYTLNDMILSRPGGSSAHVTQSTGPLSSLAPPNGVGRYTTAQDVNVQTDGQLQDIAGWHIHLGTVDEARFPTVHVNLAASPNLIAAAAAVDLGDRITITTPPPWLAPGVIDLIAQGYTERISALEWDLTYSCTPASPWTVGILDDTTLGRLDTDGTVVAAAVSSTATSLPVTITSGPLWTTDPAQMPIGVRVGGETMTATAITSISDAFGRTVSSGWGTTDTGQAWTTTGGVATDFAVASGTGQHSCSSRNVFRFSTLPSVGPDSDVRTGFSTAVTATGGSLYSFLMARYTGVNDFYFVRLEMTTAAGMILTLRKRTTAGGEVQLATFTLTATHTAGTVYYLRLACTGSTISGKCWPASSAEPDWQVTATDTDITVTGAIGVRSLVATANTNTLPVMVSFDDFRLLNQQTMTVARSVNGIVKAQSAGTDVRLAQPLILAL